jgi:hypothetical protein
VLAAEMVAALRVDVDFFVSVAGTGVNGMEIILEQTKLIMLANGEDAAKVERDVADGRIVMGMIVNGAGDDEIKGVIRKMKIGEYEKMDSVEKSLIEDKDKWVEDDVKNVFAAFSSTWMKFFLKFDPVTVLEKTRCPALMLFGGLDLQVPVGQNEGPVREALTKAGNKDFEIKTFEKANHLFQDAGNGSPNEYTKLKKEFVGGFLEYVLGWIGKRVTVVR